MVEEVVLLDFKVSMFGARVRIALNEKEIKYDLKEEEDLLGNKSPLLLTMNPIYKRIPVLIHNGKPICESLVAIEYIDEVWKEKAPLLPSDPYTRAQARFWADFIDNKLYGITRKIILMKGEEHEAAKDFIEGLKLLEGALGEGPYFRGEKFGYLDVCFIGFSCWFYTYEIFGNFSIEAECPKLIAWANRCKERSSVSNSLADPLKVYDFVLYLKKVLGFE